jgi:hypothetical protein
MQCVHIGHDMFMLRAGEDETAHLKQRCEYNVGGSSDNRLNHHTPPSEQESTTQLPASRSTRHNTKPRLPHSQGYHMPPLAFYSYIQRACN